MLAGIITEICRRCLCAQGDTVQFYPFVIFVAVFSSKNSTDWLTHGNVS